MPQGARGRTAVRIAITWTAALFAALLVGGATRAQEPRDLVRRFTPEQWERFRPLFALVHDASAGQSVPADPAVGWQSHVLKADAGMNFVPFIVNIPPGTFTQLPLAMYLRVVQRGAIAAVPGPRDALAQYPFEDVAIFDALVDGCCVRRAFAAPAGQWDVYLALADATDADLDRPRTLVLKREVELPDLTSGLALSGIILAKRIEIDQSATRPDFEAQLDEPYRLWGMRITPAVGRQFSREASLSPTFLVYNAAATAQDKPDVTIDYTFFHRTGREEALFGQTTTQVFNAETLPRAFSLAAGDLIIGGQDVPLRQFPDGDFRLQITAADRVAGTRATSIVTFTVAK